jgi:hypothetical protein
VEVSSPKTEVRLDLAGTRAALRLFDWVDGDQAMGFVRKLQRLRPPRWTSHRVTATEATTAATSRMFVTQAIYRRAGSKLVNEVDAVKTRNRNPR